MPKNDWNQYKELFLHKLSEDEKRWEKAFELLDSLKADVGGLKIKAAIAGGAAGVVGTATITFVFNLFK
jgi:hypothetical protein